MAFLNHSYNDSPVIHGEANAALNEIRRFLRPEAV